MWRFGIFSAHGDTMRVSLLVLWHLCTGKSTNMNRRLIKMLPETCDCLDDSIPQFCKPSQANITPGPPSLGFSVVLNLHQRHPVQNWDSSRSQTPEPVLSLRHHCRPLAQPLVHPRMRAKARISSSMLKNIGNFLFAANKLLDNKSVQGQKEGALNCTVASLECSWALGQSRLGICRNSEYSSYLRQKNSYLDLFVFDTLFGDQ